VLRLVAALLAVVTIAAGCSESAEDFSDEELREELVKVLTADAGITDTQATCVVDGIFDKSSDRDQINRISNAQDPGDLSEEDSAVLFDAILGCA